MQLTDGKRGATLQCHVGKVYGMFCQLDQLYCNPIIGFPDDVRNKLHALFMARRDYFHKPVFTAAYILEHIY